MSTPVPSPPAEGIAESLGLLRRHQTLEPLSPETVRLRFDLLLLPFARLIAPFEKRSLYIKPAVVEALAELAIDEQVVLRHVLVQPAHERFRTVERPRYRNWSKWALAMS
jgi:hypothetical protein